MLEKIISIDNVGVFKRGIQQATPLKKLTVIYADNARGKSTLSSIFLACAAGNTEDILTRKTVGATGAQKVALRFTPQGSAAFNSEFTGATWANERPNLHVFNQAFVERNVYAGNEVSAEQREALLNLALGQAAVAERNKFDIQSLLQKECAGKVATAEAQLDGYRGELSVDKFINLKPLADADEQLRAIDKEISEARASSAIASRSLLKTIQAPEYDLSDIEQVLNGSFTSLAINAEAKVREHFAKHKGAETEGWVALGMDHGLEEGCPFCGQQIDQLDLLKCYQEYFDKAYRKHLERVNKLQVSINTLLGDRPLIQWEGTHENNGSVWKIWSESLRLESLPDLDFLAIRETLSSALVLLTSLAEKKFKAPHVGVDTTQIEVTKSTLANLRNRLEDYNLKVQAINIRLTEYQQKLAQPDIPSLEAKRKALEIQKNRFDEKTIQLVKSVESARQDYKTAEKAKDDARKVLNEIMATTLATFQTSINTWLTRFSAPFSIDKLAPTYKGGDARSEYTLKVRGATVFVGPKSGGDIPFQSALSEGDKRTLAFAFFLATLFADEKKASSVVVLDDVFTSLDKHRRHNTIDAVLRMLAECSQVVALGHDAHFLRELKKRAAKKQLGETAELAIQRDAEDFSFVDGRFDLDDYCSSEYYKHYVLVEGYVAANPHCEKLEVAKALRLLVEGHLHRCFPKKFKDGQTVGDMLDLIKNSPDNNPLSRLKPLLPDLVNFNEFASAFHHDTSGGYQRQEVTDAELLPFAKGVLGFIQMRTFTV